MCREQEQPPPLQGQAQHRPDSREEPHVLEPDGESPGVKCPDAHQSLGDEVCHNRHRGRPDCPPCLTKVGTPGEVDQQDRDRKRDGDLLRRYRKRGARRDPSEIGRLSLRPYGTQERRCIARRSHHLGPAHDVRDGPLVVGDEIVAYRGRRHSCGDKTGDEDSLSSRYSHSIVAGGLELTSYATRLTPRTSLMIRLEIRPSTSGGNGYQSAVMPSRLVTALSATT